MSPYFRNKNQIWRAVQKGGVPPEGAIMGRKEHPLVSYYQKNQNFAELMDYDSIAYVTQRAEICGQA